MCAALLSVIAEHCACVMVNKVPGKRMLPAQIDLLRQLFIKELAARYRGSLLGIGWAVIYPLLLLSVYVFVFSGVFKAKWTGTDNSTGVFAIMVFSGIMVYNFVGDCLARAGTIILENVSFVNKVRFPIHLLGVNLVLVALFNFCINLIILGGFSVFLEQYPSMACLQIPILMFPIMLYCLGFVWFFSALGVYLRDIPHFISTVMLVLMFISPIFYPVSAVPAKYEWVINYNPLSYIICEFRNIVFFDAVISLPDYAPYLLGGVVVAVLGLLFFKNLEKGFSDVI